MRATVRDPEQQQRLERDGYVTLPFLTPDEVAGLKEQFTAVGAAPGDPGVACHSSFHSADAEYKRRVDAIVRAALGPALERVFDRQRVLPSNYIVKWPGTRSGFGLHQDLSLVDERLHRSVEVWVALDDTDEHNGQLWMVPGSHRWIPTIRGIAAFPFPFADVAERVVREHAVPVPVAAGTAVVFAHAVLHFSLPNRTDRPRMVAIADLIPEEAQHLHYFGDGQGVVSVYEIDDSFWTDNNPFTLWRPPANSRRIGEVDFEYVELTHERLDHVVASAGTGHPSERPAGSINAARPWCHRCGNDIDSDDRPHRLIGNVTLMCQACATSESGSRDTIARVAQSTAP